MKTLFTLFIAGLMLVGLTGCPSLPQRTTEAVRYYALRDTYNLTKQAYMSYLELVVRGKVSKEEEKAVDDAWNNYRDGFSTALIAASMDWSKPTPEQVQLLSTKLLTLIGKL